MHTNRATLQLGTEPVPLFLFESIPETENAHNVEVLLDHEAGAGSDDDNDGKKRAKGCASESRKLLMPNIRVCVCVFKAAVV